MQIIGEPTPQSCFDAIRPSCDELLNLARRAPLSEKERAGLTTLMATHFFGAALGDQRRALRDGRPSSAVARDLLEVLIEGLENGERPKLVPPAA